MKVQELLTEGMEHAKIMIGNMPIDSECVKYLVGQPAKLFLKKGHEVCVPALYKGITFAYHIGNHYLKLRKDMVIDGIFDIYFRPVEGTEINGEEVHRIKFSDQDYKNIRFVIESINLPIFEKKILTMYKVFQNHAGHLDSDQMKRYRATWAKVCKDLSFTNSEALKAIYKSVTGSAK